MTNATVISSTKMVVPLHGKINSLDSSYSVHRRFQGSHGRDWFPYISNTLRKGALVSHVYYYLNYMVSNRIADWMVKGIRNEVHIKVPTSEIQHLTCTVDSVSSIGRVAGAGVIPHCVSALCILMTVIGFITLIDICIEQKWLMQLLVTI